MPQVAPQLVVGKAFNSTAMNVSWVPVEQTREKVRGRLIGHRIKYWKNGTNEQDAVYYLSRTTRPWALIVGLQPDTYYFVKAMVYNAAGEGPESERYFGKTETSFLRGFFFISRVWVYCHKYVGFQLYSLCTLSVADSKIKISFY
nr:unnamed protein product [Callosobruchus analis]